MSTKEYLKEIDRIGKWWMAAYRANDAEELRDVQEASDQLHAEFAEEKE